MAITDSIKDILTVKFKPRHDDYSDQYSRIFMVKVMMISALLIGLNWYSDNITCIAIAKSQVEGDFISSACWINGLYVYEDIRYHANELGYYGMPRDINKDGILANGQLCGTTDLAQQRVKTCKPMEKTFFLQYQYLTFLMAVLGLIYYAPYGLFRFNNQDSISLKETVKERDADSIVENFFNYKVKTQYNLRMRVLGNLFIKLLYIVVNVVAFLVVDSTLNNRFVGYGQEWVKWSKLNNSMAYDYMGMRHYPKPGNTLIPSFAFCEVSAVVQDIKTTYFDRQKYVCELSQHILYQYVLILIWFAMIFGIIFSALGFLFQIVEHVITITSFKEHSENARRIFNMLTLRECEYLGFIRGKDMPLYQSVIRKLKEKRFPNQTADRPLDDEDEPCKECEAEGVKMLNFNQY